MNPKATSRNEILAACHSIVQEKGLAAISIRSAAAAAGVAPTTIYNYFPNKDALLLAVTADIWAEIFALDGEVETDRGFAAFVASVFEGARRNLDGYPGFLSGHVLGLMSGEETGAAGRKRMLDFFGGIERRFLDVLEHDPDVSPDAFGDALDPASFCSLVRDQLLLCLIMGRRDCDALLGTIRCMLYR